MINLLKKLTPPELLGQCDSNFIGMFQTVRFIQMMSLTFGLFTQVSDSGPLGPLVYDPTGAILAILYGEVTHMLPAKYQPNRPGGSGEDV